MPKLKFNEEKNRFNLKGLDGNHLMLIRSILNNVRLGADDRFQAAALDLVDAIDSEISDHGWWTSCETEFSYTSSEGFVIEVYDVADPDEDCDSCRPDCCTDC